MKRAVAALFCLTLQIRAWGFSTTMPTDVPVTIIVDKPTRGSGGGDGSPREPREPREYSSPSASSADPAEALETLAVIVAAPVIVVGGAIYLAGKAFTDWLEERRLARERAERDAAEYRRWREEEDRREAAVIADLQRRENAGREAEWGRIELLLGLLAETAEAGEFEFPYEGFELETKRYVRQSNGKNRFARQNEFNADILAAYEDLWKDSSYRTVLRLVTPLHYKVMIAWESTFDPQIRKSCAYRARKCFGVESSGMGVGLLSMVFINATDAQGAALRVDRKTDERLDPNKSIRGGLRSLRLVERKVSEIFVEKKSAPPDDATLRDLIMLGHNTGFPVMRDALRIAAEERGGSLDKLRIADLMEPRGGKLPPLKQAHLKRGQKHKFENESSKYLPGIREWLDAVKPKEENKP